MKGRYARIIVHIAFIMMGKKVQLLEEIYMSYSENNILKGTRRFLQKLAEKTGLTFYDNLVACYGRYNGHNVSVLRSNENYICVQASVKIYGQVPTSGFIHSFVKSAKCARKGFIEDGKICILVSGLTEGQLLKNTIETMDLLTDALTSNGAVDVCEHCGNADVEVFPTGHDTAVHHYCATCGGSARRIEEEKILEAESVIENVPAGILGACLGALAGAVAIILIGQLGYVAAIGGFLMSFLAFLGYEKLGKKLSTKGIIITTLIMIAMVFVACYIDYSLTLTSALAAEGIEDVTFSAILLNLFPLLDSVDYMSDFWGSLGLLYLFTVLGAFPTVKRKINERKYINDVVNRSGRAA